MARPDAEEPGMDVVEDQVLPETQLVEVDTAGVNPWVENAGLEGEGSFGGSATEGRTRTGRQLDLKGWLQGS